MLAEPERTEPDHEFHPGRLDGQCARRGCGIHKNFHGSPKPIAIEPRYFVAPTDRPAPKLSDHERFVLSVYVIELERRRGYR